MGASHQGVGLTGYLTDARSVFGDRPTLRVHQASVESRRGAAVLRVVTPQSGLLRKALSGKEYLIVLSYRRCFVSFDNTIRASTISWLGFGCLSYGVMNIDALSFK